MHCKHDEAFYKFLDIYPTALILNTIPAESRIAGAVVGSIGIGETGILATLVKI